LEFSIKSVLLSALAVGSFQANSATYRSLSEVLSKTIVYSMVKDSRTEAGGGGRKPTPFSLVLFQRYEKNQHGTCTSSLTLESFT